MNPPRNCFTRVGAKRATTQGGKVKQQRMKWITLVFALSAIMFLGACHKKTPPPPPPPPPPPAAPTASLTANPNTVQIKGSRPPLPGRLPMPPT